MVGPRKAASIALLWAREDEYWKIVSWQTELDADTMPAPPAPPTPTIVRIKADLLLVNAAKSFLEAWLIRKDYDAAFRSLSSRSYSCYDLLRGPDAPASTSLDGCRTEDRASLERVGKMVSSRRTLDTVVEAAEPLHASIRVMDRPCAGLFSLTSLPNAIGDALEVRAPARPWRVPPDPVPLEYGKAFGMTFRFRTQSGDAPVLRLLWRLEDGTWRVTAYDVVLP